jgi:hypothetical protein
MVQIFPFLYSVSPSFEDYRYTSLDFIFLNFIFRYISSLFQLIYFAASFFSLIHSYYDLSPYVPNYFPYFLEDFYCVF